MMKTHDNLVKAFFDQPERYLKYSHGIRLRARIVRDLLGDVQDARILDIGCGDGSVSLQFSPSSNLITLIDLSDNMLEQAKRNVQLEFRSRVTFLNMDFLQHQPDAPYDVVLCLGVLAHVPAVETAMRQVSRLVRPGGRCVIQFTDQERAVARIQAAFYKLYRMFRDRYGYSTNPITSQQMIQSAEQYDLHPVARRQYSLLLPGMGRLPDKFLYYYQSCTLQKTWLSRHGSEVILLLEKGNSA